MPYIPIVDIDISRSLPIISEKRSCLNLEDGICAIPVKFLEGLSRKDKRNLSAKVFVAEDPGKNKIAEYVTLLRGSEEAGLYKNMIYKGDYTGSVKTYTPY